MTQPSEEHYRGFLAALRKNAKVFNAANDIATRRSAGLAALEGAIIYLQGDVEIADAFLTRPLAFIVAAVHDSGQGANVAALKPAQGVPGRPTGMVREFVQATLAFACELLIASKMGPDDAAAWVAAEARKFVVVSEDGNPIVANQVTGWRKEIKQGRAPIEARDMFKGLRRVRPEHDEMLKGQRSEAKRKMCEALARAAVKGLAAGAPRSAPNRRG